MEVNEYDLIMIGSGPAGQKGGYQCREDAQESRHHRSEKTIGGVCVLTGTIPNKTLREAVCI